MGKRIVLIRSPDELDEDDESDADRMRDELEERRLVFGEDRGEEEEGGGGEGDLGVKGSSAGGRGAEGIICLCHLHNTPIRFLGQQLVSMMRKQENKGG